MYRSQRGTLCLQQCASVERSVKPSERYAVRQKFLPTDDDDDDKEKHPD